jgi:hypothetical protein
MPEKHLPDELDEYLRGDSVLSRQYQRENAPPMPHGLDRAVLEASRPTTPRCNAPFKSPSLAPLAFAASLLLSLAMVLALVFGPRANKPDDKPRVVQVRMFKSEPPRAAIASPRERSPAMWLAYIGSLRHGGRDTEAELEMRRFRSAYPDYIIPLNE